MLLHPPPTYKLKLTNKDEFDALVLICRLTVDYSRYNYKVYLANHIQLKLAAYAISHKKKLSITLQAHEAALFATMCSFANTFNLQPYNENYNQAHANAIHKQQTEYNSLINA